MAEQASIREEKAQAQVGRDIDAAIAQRQTREWKTGEAKEKRAADTERAKEREITLRDMYAGQRRQQEDSRRERQGARAEREEERKEERREAESRRAEDTETARLRALVDSASRAHDKLMRSGVATTESLNASEAQYNTARQVYEERLRQDKPSTIPDNAGPESIPIADVKGADTLPEGASKGIEGVSGRYVRRGGQLIRVGQ